MTFIGDRQRELTLERILYGDFFLNRIAPASSSSGAMRGGPFLRAALKRLTKEGMAGFYKISTIFREAALHGEYLNLYIRQFENAIDNIKRMKEASSTVTLRPRPILIDEESASKI